MKKTKSLSVVTGFFMGFLFSTVCNHYNEVYEPLTQHLADGNNSLAVMFGLEFTAYVIIGFCLCLFVWNINKKRFFVKQNYICFYVIGIALYSPVFVYAIEKILSKELVTIDHAAYLVAGTFMLVLAEVFRYGYLLKEEQDLTI